MAVVNNVIKELPNARKKRQDAETSQRVNPHYLAVSALALESACSCLDALNATVTSTVIITRTSTTTSTVSESGTTSVQAPGGVSELVTTTVPVAAIV